MELSPFAKDQGSLHPRILEGQAVIYPAVKPGFELNRHQKKLDPNGFVV
jgi:hypothetical protein